MAEKSDDFFPVEVQVCEVIQVAGVGREKTVKTKSKKPYLQDPLYVRIVFVKKLRNLKCLRLKVLIQYEQWQRIPPISIFGTLSIFGKQNSDRPFFRPRMSTYELAQFNGHSRPPAGSGDRRRTQSFGKLLGVKFLRSNPSLRGFTCEDLKEQPQNRKNSV